LCVEPAGTVQSVEWQYVGQGRGSFDSTAGFNFVGQGCGAYEQEVVAVPIGRRCRPLCLALLPLLAVLVLAYFLWPSSPGASTDAPTAVSPFDCEDATDVTPQKALACCEEQGLFCEQTTTALVEPPIVAPPIEPPIVQPPVVQPPIVQPPVNPGGGRQECVIWGDPHIITFDGAKGNWYGRGIEWIVRSDAVKIQGRFKPTPFTNGRAATDAIAIDVNGNTFKVSALETGDIAWNGQPVMTTLPSRLDLGGAGYAIYDTNGRIVDQAMANLPRHIVHVQLNNGLHVSIMRWSHHVNVRIEMSPQPGQEGCCGNFNGDPNDDSVAQIQARQGLSVPIDTSLFNNYVNYQAAA